MHEPASDQCPADAAIADRNGRRKIHQLSDKSRIVGDLVAYYR